MRIHCKIVGVTPLMLNRFSDEAAMQASSGSSSSSSARDRGTPLEIAEKKLYLDLDGKPCLPQPNLMRALVDGGLFHKMGKSQVTTQKSSALYGCLDIEAATIPIEHVQPWRVDSRPVVIPATKGRILAHRPIFDDWALTFELVLDENIVGERLLRQIVDDAGSRIGLGDFRPARKGPFGRYRVDAWQVQQLPKLKAA